MEAYLEISTLAMLQLVSAGAYVEHIVRQQRVDGVTGKHYDRFIDVISGRAFDVVFVDSDMQKESSTLKFVAVPVQTDVKAKWG